MPKAPKGEERVRLVCPVSPDALLAPLAAHQAVEERGTLSSRGVAGDGEENWQT